MAFCEHVSISYEEHQEVESILWVIGNPPEAAPEFPEDGISCSHSPPQAHCRAGFALCWLLSFGDARCRKKVGATKKNLRRGSGTFPHPPLDSVFSPLPHAPSGLLLRFFGKYLTFYKNDTSYMFKKKYSMQKNTKMEVKMRPNQNTQKHPCLVANVLWAVQCLSRGGACMDEATCS